MDFFGDLESQIHGQLVYEHVQSRHVETVVILEGLLDVEVELIRDLVLRLHVVQEKKFFLQGGLRAIIISDQSTQSTRDQVESKNTCYHDHYWEEALHRSACRNVTVPHCRHRRYCPVDRSNVQVEGPIVLVRVSKSPDIVCVLVELRQKYKHAATDVQEENCENSDKHETFNTWRQLHWVAELWKDRIVAFEELEKFSQTREPDQLV